MEILALILGVAGLIWGAVLLRRGGLLAGCLAVMLAGACFGLEFFKLPLGPVPLTADRLLMVVLVGQYLLWRRFGWADPKPLGKPEILLCLFICVMLISTFSADYSATNYQPVAWLIIFYLMPFGMYWIARQTTLSGSEKGADTFCAHGARPSWPPQSGRDARAPFPNPVQFLFISLAVFGAYLALTSLAEHYELSWAVFPRYIVDTAAKANAEFVGRARGPFLHPVGNGIALAICLGASLMLWPQIPRGLSHFLRQEEDNLTNPLDCRKNWDCPPRGDFYARLGQLLLVPLFLLFAAALCFTLTRSVWIGGAFTLALIVGLSLPWNWRMPILIGGLLLAVAFSATEWERLMAFKRDKNLDADKVAESVELRPVLARIAWEMFLDRPLFGCGYAQYGKEHVSYLTDRSTALVLEKGHAYIQHNVVFSLLTETGLLGLGLFLLLCGLWGLDAWRLWQSPTAPLASRQMGLLMLAALGVYFINGMFHDVSVIPMANMTLFFLAGVTAGLRSEIYVGDTRRVGFAHQSETPQEEETPIMVGEAHPT